MANITMNELVRWLIVPGKEIGEMKLQVWGRNMEGEFGWVDVPIVLSPPDGSMKLNPLCSPRESTVIMEDE
jgi:hypothetical protein